MPIKASLSVITPDTSVVNQPTYDSYYISKLSGEQLDTQKEEAITEAEKRSENLAQGYAPVEALASHQTIDFAWHDTHQFEDANVRWPVLQDTSGRCMGVEVAHEKIREDITNEINTRYETDNTLFQAIDALQQQNYELELRIAALEETVPPEEPAPIEPPPVPVISREPDMTKPTVLVTIGFLGVGSIDLTAPPDGFTVPADGVVIFKDAELLSIGEEYIALNGMKLDTESGIISIIGIDVLTPGAPAQFEVHTGDIVTAVGINDINYYPYKPIASEE